MCRRGGGAAVFQDRLDFPAAYTQLFSERFTLLEAHFRVLDLRTSIIILRAVSVEKWPIQCLKEG